MRIAVFTYLLLMQFVLNAQFGFVKEFPSELSIFSIINSANQVFEDENHYQIYINQGEAYSYHDSSVVYKFSIDKTNGEIAKQYIYDQNSCNNHMSAIRFNFSNRSGLEYGSWYSYGDTCGGLGRSGSYSSHFFTIDEEGERSNVFTKKDLIDILPDSLAINTLDDVYYMQILGQDLDSNYLVHLTRNSASETPSVLYSLNIETFEIKWILELSAGDYPNKSLVTEDGYYLIYHFGFITVTRDGKLNKTLYREVSNFTRSFSMLPDDHGNLVVAMNERDVDSQDYIINPVIYNFDLDTIGSFDLRLKNGGDFYEHKNDIWKFSTTHEFGAYTSNGDLIWKKHIGEIVECRERISIDYACWINNIIATSDGGFLLVVKKVPSYILVKTDCMGNIEWTSDNCYIGNTHNFEVYPNPVYDNIAIHFKAEIAPEELELLLYDLNGKEVKKIIPYQDTSTLYFDVTNLLEGLYLYRLLYNGDLVKTDKIIKL